jgi:hypothetical protein
MKFEKIQIKKYNRTHQTLNSELTVLIDIDNNVEVNKVIRSGKWKIIKLAFFKIYRLLWKLLFYKAMNIEKCLSDYYAPNFVIL